MASKKSCEELEQELAREKKKVEELTEMWMRGRKITVRQLRELADEIQLHEDNSRIAKIAGSSAGIVGGSLAIAGFVCAFFTFGATFGLTIAGMALTAAGTGTYIGTEITNSVLRSGKIKEVIRALEKDKDACSKLYEELVKYEGVREKLETSIKQSGKGQICENVLSGLDKAFSGVQIGLQVGKVIGNEAGETTFRTLGNVGRGFHFAGFAFNTIFIAVDIYTLVKTSIEIHKGCRLKVAEDIDDAAKVLEEEMENPPFMADNEPSDKVD